MVFLRSNETKARLTIEAIILPLLPLPNRFQKNSIDIIDKNYPELVGNMLFNSTNIVKIPWNDNSLFNTFISVLKVSSTR